MSPLLTSAPASAVIDDSNFLTLSWTPVPTVLGSFADYDHWDITVDATTYRSPASGTVPFPPSGKLGTQTFTQSLGSGAHSMTMQGKDSVNAAVTLPWQTNGSSISRQFPDVLASSSVQLSLTSVLLGQTLNVTLDSLYTGADQWQVIWPDGSSTGWLPLSANVVAKAFTVPGSQNIVVQTRRDYSAAQYNPPATLIRQTNAQIFVVDQQQSSTTTGSGGLTGDLGIGGQQGFEITDAASAGVTPNPWEVIARAFVRDTVTSELKLLVATSRFSNASSLFGTMAIDVFPVEGRPHSKELIVPVYELMVTNANTSPVKIQTSTLPNLIVGKSVAQALGGTLAMTVKDNTGVQPFLWSAVGLPDGVVMSSSGVISGTPTQLGTFTATFAVQDSNIPFSIDEITLSLTVTTDLKVQIATGQHDAQNNVLSPLGTSLGVAQVLTPYTVQMQVGNTNPSATSAGGLPPYQWSIPSGSLPIGLSINPDTGVISGNPCTYNSTTDYNKTYTAIIQVTDAIGAKATQTYTMTLIPAKVQFTSNPDQTTIYSAQDFKLVASIFGGFSPYTFGGFFPDVSGYYVTPTGIVDGQVEVLTNVPTTGTGSRSFILVATDSIAVSTGPTSINYQAGNEISDIRIIKAFANHYWAAGDAAASIPLAISGDFSGYTLGGTTLVLTAAANASGGNTIYTGSIGSGSYAGLSVTITGFANAANNGVFLCTANSTTTITLANPNGVAQTHAGKAIINLSPALANGIALAIDPTIPQITATGPATTFGNAQLRIPLQLSQSTTTVGTISREYTFLAHDDTAAPGDIGVISSAPRPYIVGDLVALNPRKPYYNSITPIVPASISGAGYTARVQSGSSLPPGLSLDANTGLIYGVLVGVSTGNSVVEYIDNSGTVHGTVTINWTTYANDFPLINLFGNADGQQIGTPYPDSAPVNTVHGTTILQAPTGTSLSAVQVIYPQYQNQAGYGLPAGVSLVVDNSVVPSVVRIQGTPTEAGYFDIWLKITGNSSQSSYINHRLSVDYTKPMVILTSSLPDISAQPYSVTLNGYGGIPPYTWSSPQFPGGVGVGVLTGLTLVSNPDNTATISGTLVSPPGTSPTPLFTVGSPLTITLTDTRGSGSSVSKPFTFTYDNRLRITTPTVPIIVASSDYAFSMHAAGGVPPYTWQIANSPTLPSGITFDAIQPLFGTTGAFSGITSVTGYDQFINITVKDSLSNTSSGYNLSGNPYEIKTGAAGLLINQSNVTKINRGVPYQGTLTVTPGILTPSAPVSWQIAPTPSFPKTLLPGLSLNADAGTQGINAIIAGTYTGVPHQVEGIISIVGNGTTAIVTTKQSHGFVNADHVVIAGSTHFDSSVGGNPAFWTVSAPTTAGFTINATPNFTDTPTSATATVATNLYQIRVVATDALGEVAVALVQLDTSTDLAVTTTALPNATVGGSYSVTLNATGGVTPYSWSIDPLSVDSLTGTGLSLSAGGVLSGTPSGIFTKNLTFRVTDNLGGTPNIARATMSIVSQASGLAITTTSITPATSGRAYTFTLQAAGSPNLPYTWSIVGGALPTGLTLNSTTGVISGTTSLTGFNQPVTFRVTDSIAAHVDKPLTVAVVAGLALVTGIDFTDGTNTGIIGYVANGQVDAVNPRPNLSFYIVAQGVVSTSAGTMSVSVGNSNITGNVTQISGGNAYIKLSGSGFDAGSQGTNSLSVSVTDNGVNVSGSFTWVVYGNGNLTIGATLPTQLTTP